MNFRTGALASLVLGLFLGRSLWACGQTTHTQVDSGYGAFSPAVQWLADWEILRQPGCIVYPGFDGVRSLTHLDPVSVKPLNVALISDAVAQAEQIQRAAAPGTIAIIYQSDTMTAMGLVNLLTFVSAAHNAAQIGHLGIVAHGRPGEVDLGERGDLNLATLRSQATTFERLWSLLTKDARLDLYSCSVAAGANGKAFVDELAAVTNATVFASDNPVGTMMEGDLVWEYRKGQAATNHGLFLCLERLRRFQGYICTRLRTYPRSTINLRRIRSQITPMWGNVLGMSMGVFRKRVS